jgi:hypothetical protein
MMIKKDGEEENGIMKTTRFFERNMEIKELRNKMESN